MTSRHAPAARALPLIVGPLPPPVGGIATMVAKLFEDPTARGAIRLLDTRKQAGRLFSLRLLGRVIRHIAGRPSRVLAFSSAYRSFWEKALWLLVARWRGVPMLLMMVDGNFPAFYSGLARFQRALVRRALERCETVITQTEGWRHFYQEIAPAARLAVLSNGVDVNEFPLHQRGHRSVPVVLFVGWLIPAKGVFDLIEAAAILRREGLAFTVELLGPEHGHGAQIRESLRANGLADVVRIRPEVWSRPELVQAYYGADVFALPSWAEGLPNALMEAMASGLPAVGTDVGGIPDVIESGISGTVVPPRNPQSLAAALRPLLSDPDLRRRMGASASARISAAFRNDAFVAGLRALLAGGA